MVVSGKVSSWVDELKVLALFAITQPHAAFSRGLISKWLFIARTVPNVSHLFQLLENCGHHHFIPSATGHGCSPPGDFERDLFALPAKMGGLGISNPIFLSSTEFPASDEIIRPLQSLIPSQASTYVGDVRNAQISIKSKIKRLKSSRAVSTQS